MLVGNITAVHEGIVSVHLLQTDHVRVVAFQLVQQTWKSATPLQVLQQAVRVPAAHGVLVCEYIIRHHCERRRSRRVSSMFHKSARLYRCRRSPGGPHRIVMR